MIQQKIIKSIILIDTKMDYKTAVLLEGYLEKQSPNLLKNYKKRYFAYRSKGEFLIWFKKKPNSVQDQPKGIIKIEEIDYVKRQEGQQRIFKLKYHDRQFIIRAEDLATRDKWVQSIQGVIGYFKKVKKNQPKKIQFDKSDKARKWKWEEADEEEIKKIRLQNQKMILAEGEDNIKQNSNKFMNEVLGLEPTYDFEKCLLYGYFNRKGFLSNQTRWYFICSEYNLLDEGDQEPYQKVSKLLQNHTIIKADQKDLIQKQDNNSSDSSQEQTKIIKPKSSDNSPKINHIYQFDVKNKKLVQTIPLLQVINWTQNTKDSPFYLKITYASFQAGEQQGDLEFVQEEKELILYTSYITQIQKWSTALKICFQRYSISIQRDKILQKRFVRYKIKKIKAKEDEQWRIIGSQAKPEFVYLNRQQIKVGGFTFKLQDCSDSLKSEKVKQNQDQGHEVKDSACSFWWNKQKVTLVFWNAEDQRSFRKRAKKFIKKIQAYLQEKNIREAQHEIQERNLNTYYMDKKIRQTSGSIKINFYEMMEQDSSNQQKKVEKKDPSFLDKFFSMFCGTPIEQDLYF